MNTIPYSLLRLFGLAAGALAGFSLLFSGSPHASGFSVTSSPGASEIRGYQTWTRVNQEPAIMDAATAALCAQMVKTQNPHQSKFINVFVNDIGKNAMLSEKQPKFPQGSVIVKQKLASPDSTEPEALTAMIKRAEGYNPEGGDWEYLVASGDGISIVSRGKTQSCQACHSMYKATDFITRQYLSPEQKRRLQ